MDKFELKEMIISYLKKQYRKTLENATKDELYQAVVFAISGLGHMKNIIIKIQK